MMNEKLKQKIGNIIATILVYFIIGYILISLFFAILLPIYNYILVPMANMIAPYIEDSYNYAILHTNLLNLSPDEKAFALSQIESIHQTTQQIIQSFQPIPFDQLVKAELVLAVPPLILLLLIYHGSKDHDE